MDANKVVEIFKTGKALVGMVIVTVGALSTLIVFINKNLTLHEHNAVLTAEGKERDNKIAILEGENKLLNGWKDGVNHTIQAFMENPPSATVSRLDRVEDRMERYHGTAVVQMVDTGFVNRLPH